jgi:hypothetical protein
LRHAHHYTSAALRSKNVPTLACLSRASALVRSERASLNEEGIEISLHADSLAVLAAGAPLLADTPRDSDS